MSLFVLDTDLLTLYHRGDPIVVRRGDTRLSDELAFSILTVLDDRARRHPES
jgi:hypothetical protein